MRSCAWQKGGIGSARMGEEEAPEAVELYKITGIREVTDITPEGVFIKLMEVTYETKSGVSGSVRIRKEEFSKAKAAELIEREAREIEETLKLRR